MGAKSIMRLLIVVGLLPLFSTSPLFPAPINTQTGLYSNKDLGLQARTEANRLISTLQELSENSQLQPLDRGTLAESAPILDTVTTFLSELSTKTKNFENVCSTGEEASDRGVRVMGEILDSLADLAERLGNNRVAEEISKRKGIPDQIFRQLTEKDIGLELGLDCLATDLSGTAATLEDIANVIRDIGFDTLKSELGVDIDLSLLG